MLETITLEEAQISLPALIERLLPGAEIIITQNQQPVARLNAANTALPTPQFGSCRGALTVISEDDEHLTDFQEYLT